MKPETTTAVMNREVKKGDVLAVARVADVERMQMLVECPSRTTLRQMLSAWLPLLHSLRARHKGLVRWAIDVDPLAI